MYRWCLLVVVLHFLYTWQHALALQSSPMTESTIRNDIDTLRHLINQQMLIIVPLSRDVYSLFQEQRALVNTNQATNKTLSDLQTTVQRLARVTEALNRQSLNLSNEVSSFIKSTQAREKNLSTQVKDVKTNLLGYADAIVQAACAAASTEGFVSAVRRTCSHSYPSCDELCRRSTSQMKSKNGDQGANEARCFQAFRLYQSESEIPPSSDGQVNKVMYRYYPRDCFTRFCGPNFCCCRLTY